MHNLVKGNQKVFRMARSTGPLATCALVLLVCHFLFQSTFVRQEISNSQEEVKQAKLSPQRLCTQNQYAKTLSQPLSDYAKQMDTWLSNKVEIEKDLVYETQQFRHDHKRFEAFEVMGSCKKTCVGGECGSDLSKIVCGLLEDEDKMEAPCVVYSIGGNNQWDFELDVLSKTPCEVHTFDCTRNRERFRKPDNDRLHFHYVCLGTVNKPETKDEKDSGKITQGEFWTLEKMQRKLNHLQIDLFKVDIEGYEWPMFESWPTLTDMRSLTTALPMQVLVEVHYRTQMPELSSGLLDWKWTTDMINLQAHFLKMGYAVVMRDDNNSCPHCTELTLVRMKCPPT